MSHLNSKNSGLQKLMIFTKTKSITVNIKRAKQAMRVVLLKAAEWRNTKVLIHQDLSHRIKIKTPFHQIKI